MLGLFEYRLDDYDEWYSTLICVSESNDLLVARYKELSDAHPVNEASSRLIVIPLFTPTALPDPSKIDWRCYFWIGPVQVLK